MRIVPLDDPAEPLLDPDIVWDGRIGDLATTSLSDPVNPGGLRSGQALATAVLICLMTDRRVDASELPDGVDNRGWPGDGFDLAAGERPLGSKLWLLRRRALTAEIETLAEDYALEALQTLIDQRAVVRVEASALADRAANRMTLDVRLYGRDGARVYDQSFVLLWDQIDGVRSPLAR